jgi:hypothetical protein
MAEQKQNKKKLESAAAAAAAKTDQSPAAASTSRAAAAANADASSPTWSELDQRHHRSGFISPKGDNFPAARRRLAKVHRHVQCFFKKIV